MSGALPSIVPSPPAPSTAPHPAPRPPRIRLDHVAGPLAVLLWAWQLLQRYGMGPGGGVGPLDARECQVGVLAHRVSERGLWAVLDWQGPLAAAADGAALGLLGVAAQTDVAWLRALPWLFWGVASAWLLWLCRRWMGARAGLACALVLAATLPSVWSVQARAWGGVAWGTLVAVWALGGASSLSVTKPRTRSFGAGLGAGLVLAAHQDLWPLVVGVVVAALLGVASVMQTPQRFFAALDHAARLVAGAVVGLTPLWLGTGGQNLWATLLARAQETQRADPVWLAQTALGQGVDGLGAAWGVVVVALVWLGGAGVMQRVWANGMDQPAVRLGCGALATCVATVWAWATQSAVSQDADALLALPLMVTLPVLAALAAGLVRGGWVGLAVAAAGVAVAAPLPQAAETVARQTDAHAVVEWLGRHPGTACFGAADLAWQVAFQSAEAFPCVSLGVPGALPEWLDQTAGGPRAYFFAADEDARVAVLEADARRVRRRVEKDVAGTTWVRIMDGSPWPPVVPAVVSEHARRDRRALMDGDLATGVTTGLGTPAEVDLVWPTSLGTVMFWPDVRNLGSAPCSARASVLGVAGRWELGPVVRLDSQCLMARRWALWPQAGWAVRLPVPGTEATRVRVASPDEDARFTLTEVRVVPRGMRAR